MVVNSFIGDSSALLVSLNCSSEANSSWDVV